MSTTYGQSQLPSGGLAAEERARFLLAVDLGSGERALTDARDRLGRWLSRIGVRGEEFWEILTAVGEACANAFEHSGADANGPFGAWIEGWLQGRQLHVVIGDHGAWREPDAARSQADRRGHGRLMMCHLMDTMVINPGPAGTVVHLSKQLASPMWTGSSGESAWPAARRHLGRRTARAHAT